MKKSPESELRDGLKGSLQKCLQIVSSWGNPLGQIAAERSKGNPSLANVGGLPNRLSIVVAECECREKDLRGMIDHMAKDESPGKASEIRQLRDDLKATMELRQNIGLELREIDLSTQIWLKLALEQLGGSDSDLELELKKLSELYLGIRATEATLLPADVRAGLERCNALAALYAKERTFLENCASELGTLQLSFELSDPASVSRLTALQTLAQFGGGRLQERANQLEQAKEDLMALSNEFISTALAPRFKHIQSRAYSKVATPLKSFFESEEQLSESVYRTSTMQELLPIEHMTVVAHLGREYAVRTAQDLLKAWESADAFEKKHLS